METSSTTCVWDETRDPADNSDALTPHRSTHRTHLLSRHTTCTLNGQRSPPGPRTHANLLSLSLIRPTVSVVSPPLRCSSSSSAAAFAMRLWGNSAPAPSLLVLAPGSAPHHRRRHLSPARASSAPRRRARLGMTSVKGREEVVLHARRKAKGACAARAAKAAEPPGTRSRALLEIIGTPLRHI